MRRGAPALGVWLLGALVLVTETSKLSVPKVLLPFTRGNKINFTLEVTEGCYKWSSTRPEVASIEPANDDEQPCSQRAVVQARASHPMRLTSIIFAEDIYTGQVLRCDAIVDIVHYIQIVSTTRELYLEDSPLALKIQALDSEGNTFSTLAGLLFEWTVVKETETDGFSDSHNTLRILKFMESSYVPPTYITEMEKVAKQGDTVLVSGMKTGSAKMRAKMLEPMYEEINPAEVRLIILENILLNPASDVYLLVASSIQYKVQKIKQGKAIDVVMPSEQYILQLQNHTVTSGGNDADPVAELDQGTSVVTAMQQGQTKIVLLHKNIRMQGSSRLPNGTIFVVEPGYLGFTIHPGDRWVLETGRYYEIIIDVYDKSSNKIYLSENVRIEAKLPEEFFRVESSLNGSYHRVLTLKSGQTVIDAALTCIVDQDGGVHMLPTPVRNQQELEIYPPIKLSPKILTFPWQPKPGAYQYKIQVQGGSGNFTWSSSNNSVATVTVKGVINTGHDIGVSVIRARDVQNLLHFGEMKVFVIVPSGMEFIACRVEAQVGNKLELPLRIFGLINGEDKEEVTLTDCTQFDLVVEMETSDVFRILQGRLHPSDDYCSGITVQAEAQGYTTIFVSYTHDRVHLKASIVVAAYLPLKSIDPMAVALVTLGSSKDMLFEGGPKPWILEPLMYFRNISGEKTQQTRLSLLEAPTSRNHIQHSVRVLCRDLEEQVISLTVGNSPTETNPFPAVEVVAVKMICAPPARFFLRPVYKHAYLDMPCPLMQQNQQVIPVSNSQNQLLELVAYDHQGRKFDNFSSLGIEWHSSKDSLASFPEPMELVSKEDHTGQRKLHGFNTVHVHFVSGTAVITAQAQKYQESHLTAAEVSLLHLKLAPIATSLDLLLVEDMKVNPNSISIFNHPLTKGEITVKDGSGYFYINSSRFNIVKTAYEDQNGTILVYPLHPGKVTVQVYDLCLVLPMPAEVRVEVSDIFQVDVTVVDKVEIRKVVKAYIRVLDSAKKPFLAKYLSYMNLDLASSSPIVSIKPLPERIDSYTAVYNVRGEAVGLTSLTASATDKAGHSIDSAPRSLEVFPPFRLLPRKITLLIGAVMQITSEGGPQPQSNIMFSVTKDNIASVDGNGFVEGLFIGNCTVTGVVQAIDAESGNLVVVSRDTVEVEVLQLRAIRIHAPITRMKSGTQMPVYVTGVTSEQSPFSFGNAVPQLSFHWTVQKKDFLDIRSRHDEVSVSLPAWYNFAINVYAKMKGKTGLKVTVRANDPQQFYGSVLELSDEIQIQVFERLQLTKPDVNAGQILMAPNSFLKLETNRDQTAAAVKYHIISTPRMSPVVQVDDKGLLTTGSQTGISTIEINSEEYFGINQTFIISVKVSPVSYIRIVSSPVLHIRDNHKLSTIPLGVTLTLFVQFHDNTGELFHAQNSFLNLATNRDDLVQVGKGVTNYTFTVQTVNVGLTIFHVWDIENPVISDYVPFPVEHSIFPSLKEITVGDVICFTCSINNQEGLVGIWTSSSISVLQIDSKTGVALAKHVGFVTIYYEVPGLLRTYREAMIGSPQKIQITEASAERISLQATNAHKFVVQIGERSTNLKGECSAGHIETISELHPEDILSCQVQFQDQKLEISPLDIFTTKPGFDVESGYYTCSITTHSLSENQLKLLTTSDVSLTITASLQGINFHVEQASTTVPIYPGFYANQKEIFLSNHHTKSELRIFGAPEILKSIEVKAGSRIVKVALMARAQGKPSSVTYEIGITDMRILSQESLSTFVTVSSSSFEQVIVVPVMLVSLAEPNTGFFPEEQSFFQDLTGSYQGIVFTIFALLATVSLLYIVF